MSLVSSVDCIPVVESVVGLSVIELDSIGRFENVIIDSLVDISGVCGVGERVGPLVGGFMRFVE